MNFCHFKWIAVGAAFIFSFSLFSCSSTSKVAGSCVAPVYVTNTKKYYLMEPSKIEKNVDSYLFLKGKFGSNEFGLLSMLQMDTKSVYLCLLSDFGNTLGELFFDGKKVDLDCALLPEKLKGEYIVADLQFAFYKSEEVSKILSEIGLSLEIQFDSEEVDGKALQDGSEKEVRRIMHGKKCIEKITKSSKSVLIENLLRGYSYELVNSFEIEA